MKLIIEINTDNNEFRNPYNDENIDRVAVWLAVERSILSAKFSYLDEGNLNKPIKDINGNTVGKLTILTSK